jgi:hypothetical protein
VIAEPSAIDVLLGLSSGAVMLPFAANLLPLVSLLLFVGI